MSFREKDVVILSIIVCLCAVSAVFTKHVDNNNRSKRTVDSQNSCENVIQFFALKNITVPRDATKGKSTFSSTNDRKSSTRFSYKTLFLLSGKCLKGSKKPN